MSLTLDASLNLYFMRIVQKQLIEPGLNKYKPLVSHNLRIVCIVLLMDVSFEKLTMFFGREVRLLTLSVDILRQEPIEFKMIYSQG